jgi:PKD repeat protein
VTIATYSWNFGDGGTSTTGPTISHTYASAGVYTVTLTMTTTTGCTITTTQSDTVGAHSTPAFSGTPTTMCYKTPVFFTNTSTGATNYTWLYGDGGSSTLANPSYVYGDTGTFNVTLISTNNGCNDTLKKTNLLQSMVRLPTLLTYIVAQHESL